jgi:hypothetical protein
MTGRRGAQDEDLRNKVARVDFEDWSNAEFGALLRAAACVLWSVLWLLHRWMDVEVLHDQGWVFGWREHLMIEEPKSFTSALKESCELSVA